MNPKAFQEKYKFVILADSMQRLGLNPDEVDDKAEAIERIYNKFSIDGLEIDCECEECKADIPDLDFCPFCGSEFREGEDIDPRIITNRSKGIPGEFYRGARRGQKAKTEKRNSGGSLFNRLITVLGIPAEWIRYNKSITSLWCNWGMFARCFVGTYSTRILLPFAKADYPEELQPLLIDLDAEQKNMFSRLAVETFDEVEGVVSILKQTVLLKKTKAEAKKRGKTKQKSSPETKPVSSGKPPKKPSKPGEDQ